jgi:hypothetical protein
MARGALAFVLVNTENIGEQSFMIFVSGDALCARAAAWDFDLL